MQKKDIPDIKSYEADRENSDIAIVPYSVFPIRRGPNIGMPVRRKNHQVIKVNDYAIINGDMPASAFAIGLHTCSAFIYIYPKEKVNVNKMDLNEGIDSLDHLVVYHSPSSIIKPDRDPLTPMFNPQKTDPKNIKVIIGTPNAAHEKGIEEVVNDLIEKYGITKENIFVYYRCGGSFGADSYGNIGELGQSLRNYAATILSDCFIEAMQNAGKLWQPPSTTDIKQKVKKLMFWEKSEEQSAEKFISSMKQANSIESIYQIAEEYLRSGEPNHPLKILFLQKLAAQLNKVKYSVGIELPNTPQLNDIQKFLGALIEQINRDANINLENLKVNSSISTFSYIKT